MKLNLLDTVVLKADMPEKHLYKDDIGTIVEMYGSDGLEVEFITGDGHTQALVTLNRDNVRLVSGSDVFSVRTLDEVA